MISAETRGLERMKRKVRRMPVALRASTGRAARENAFDLLRGIQIGVPKRTRDLLRSAKAEPLTGSSKTGWRVVSGGGDAFYGHIVDGGTRPGRRRITRGRRKGQSYDHPGTRATGYHRGRYRLEKRAYRARMRRAYREGAKAT